MRLFHGSLAKVESPRILAGEMYRPLDFGAGFYTTTDFDQASRWVKVRLARNPDATIGYVMTYDLDEAEVAVAGLNIKRFDGASPEWLRFIMANRMQGNVEHGYDIVIGPVANDRVYTVLNMYEGGYLEEADAIARMKTYRLADQVLFHTARAIALLRHATTVEVRR